MRALMWMVFVCSIPLFLTVRSSVILLAIIIGMLTVACMFLALVDAALRSFWPEQVARKEPNE